jgi:REP element-mobilizing transposase RayT
MTASMNAGPLAIPPHALEDLRGRVTSAGKAPRPSLRRCGRNTRTRSTASGSPRCSPLPAAPWSGGVPPPTPPGRDAPAPFSPALSSFWDSQRYELGDWVVMPNHVHVLFRPLGEHRLPDILQSWKSFTAKAINKALGRTGSVWQEDYWDRLIRNERHLHAVQRYIAGNPAKAGLREREWSGRFLQRSEGVPPPERGGASRRT